MSGGSEGGFSSRKVPIKYKKIQLSDLDFDQGESVSSVHKTCPSLSSASHPFPLTHDGASVRLNPFTNHKK